MSADPWTGQINCSVCGRLIPHALLQSSVETRCDNCDSSKASFPRSAEILLTIKIRDAIGETLRDEIDDGHGRFASVIGSACWYALKDFAACEAPSAVMCKIAFGFDAPSAILAAAKLLDPDGEIEKTLDSDHRHDPEPYGDGEWARCKICGDDGFPVTFDAAYGLPPNTSRIVQDQMHTAELLGLLRAYHAGADRGELKAMLDRAWGTKEARNA